MPEINGKKVEVQYNEIGEKKFNDAQKVAIKKFVDDLSKIPSEKEINDFLRNRAYSIKIEEGNSVVFTFKLD